MTEDLFEEENEDEEKSSEKEKEVFAEDDTAEESFEYDENKESTDDEELEISLSDDDIDELPEEEEIGDEVLDEVYAEEDEGDEKASDDEEPWIPLDDEELELSPSDEEIDALSEDDEEVEMDVGGEIEETSEVESKEEAPDDEEAWIPLDEKELELSPSDEEIDALSLDQQIGDEALDEVYNVEEEAVEEADENDEIEMDSELEEPLDDGNIGVFANHMNEEAEAPPWDEGVEIPIHGTTGPPKKNRTFLIAGIFAVIALILIGLYAVFQYRPTLVEKDVKPKGSKPSFVTKQMETTAVKKPDAEKRPEEIPGHEPMAMKINTAPSISGTPIKAAHEGISYRFIPEANDVDNGDRLIFFIANQPAWTSFDTSTGALTGTPRKEHVGIYENIVILVSDGTATASLPDFSITVTEVKPSIAEEEKPQQDKGIAAKPEEVKKPQPIIEAKKEEPKKAEVGQYELPDLTDLVKQSEYQDAALEYLKEVKQFPKAYSLKLEVDCAVDSLSTAFRQGNFDRRMFILPRDIRGKDCFVVFWGLYATKMEAIKAISSIPDFFNEQATKPELVVIKQYL